MFRFSMRWVAALLAGMTSTAAAQQQWVQKKLDGTLRIATFNASLNRAQAGELTRDLEADDSQAKSIAAIIRAVQPDILLLNELDYAERSNNASLFERHFLAASEVDRFGNKAWPMPYVFSAAVNTGVLSDLDINGDGTIALPDDGWGYGKFPGQYGMAVLSRFPIELDQVQTLQNLLWSTLPAPLAPNDPKTNQPFYPASVWRKLRLASKSFWDVPILTPLGSIHVLASHPTPPAFDGPEDRNGCRNHDEIRLISAYIDSEPGLLNDRGKAAGLKPRDAFVVLGDLNSDPKDGGSRSDAIRELLSHNRVAQFPAPRSPGGASASNTQGRANLKHAGDASEDTADFNDYGIGNLRVDYVLPSNNFQVRGSGVFWPDLTAISAEHRQAVRESLAASDHRLVWVDVASQAQEY